jgi:hypothetical protein
MNPAFDSWANSWGIHPGEVKGACAMGTDIRPDSWDVGVLEVVRAGPGKLMPRMVFYGKVPDEDGAIAVAKAYRVRASVSDSSPDATLAERMQKKLKTMGIKAYRARYNTAPSEIKLVENVDEGLLRLERTMVLDDVHFAFQTCTIAIPQNFRAICRGDFWRELIVSSRVPTRWHGREYFKWENAGPDHAFHCLSYALVAIDHAKLIGAGGDVLMGSRPGLMVSSLARSLDPAGPLGQGALASDEMDDDYEGATWEA